MREYIIYLYSTNKMNPFRDPSTYFQLLPVELIQMVHQMMDDEQRHLWEQSLAEYRVKIDSHVQKQTSLEDHVPSSFLFILPVAPFMIYTLMSIPRDPGLTTNDRILFTVLFGTLTVCFLSPTIYLPYLAPELYYRFQCWRLRRKLRSFRI